MNACDTGCRVHGGNFRWLDDRTNRLDKGFRLLSCIFESSEFSVFSLVLPNFEDIAVHMGRSLFAVSHTTANP